MGEMGADVVRAVQAKLENSNLFTFDESQVYELFIREAAYVESLDGRENHDGGIWNVSRHIFEQTQQYNLPELYDGICDAFCLIWADIQYSDLRVPLHSGIAVHIYLHYLYNTSRLQPTSDKAMYWVTSFGEDRNVLHWSSRIEMLQREEGNGVGHYNAHACSRRNARHNSYENWSIGWRESSAVSPPPRGCRGHTSSAPMSLFS